MTPAAACPIPPTRWAARRGRRAQHEPTASRMLRTADRPPCSRVAQRQLGHHLTWLAGSLQPPRPCVRCFALDYGYRLSVVHEQTRVPPVPSQFRQMAKRPGNCCEVMKSKSAGQAIHRGVAAGHGEGADSTRPTGRLHPPHMPLTWAGLWSLSGRGTFGAHARRSERSVERVAGTAAGLGDQVAIQVHGGRDRLVAEPTGDLGDRHAFGQRGAGKAVSLMRNSA